MKPLYNNSVIRLGLSRVDKYKDAPKIVKQLQWKIAYEKRQYETCEVILQHRLELGVLTPKAFMVRMKAIEERKDNNVKYYREQLKPYYKPKIKYDKTYNDFACYNKYFRKEYDVVIYGLGDSPKEAYEEWLDEMKDYGHNLEGIL